MQPKQSISFWLTVPQMAALEVAAAREGRAPAQFVRGPSVGGLRGGGSSGAWGSDAAEEVA